MPIISPKRILILMALLLSSQLASAHQGSHWFISRSGDAMIAQWFQWLMHYAQHAPLLSAGVVILLLGLLATVAIALTLRVKSFKLALIKQRISRD